MKKIAMLLALAIPPWLATKFGAPKWGVILSIVPFGLFAMSMGDSDENLLGKASSGVGKWLFLLVGIGGLVLGTVAFSFRDTSSFLGVLWWMLPVAAIVFIVGVVRVWRD